MVARRVAASYFSCYAVLILHLATVGDWEGLIR